MKRIARNPSLHLAVEEIEQEHIEIQKILNHLIADPDANSRSETISESLSRLTRYALDHFAAEEKLMKQHEYPDFASHRKCHIAFQERMFMFCHHTMDHKPTVPSELYQYIGDWLEEHIIAEDMRYLSFFEKHGLMDQPYFNA